MKKIVIILTLILALSGQMSLAMQPELVSGLRGDGLAFGIMADHQLSSNVGIRFGIEATTGKSPVFLFLGGKFYLTSFRKRQPMSLGLGVISFFSSGQTNTGLALSLIFNRALDIEPLFFEVGADIVQSSAKLQAQVGYKVFF